MSELLIDVGTTYIKYLRIDESLDIILGEGRVAVPRCIGGALRDEVDAEEVLAIVESIVHENDRQCGGLAAIRMSTQMHSFLLTSLGGAPITNLITWRDRRPLEAGFREGVYELVSRADGPGTRMGQGLRPNLPVVKLLHLQNEQPKLFSDGPVAVHTIGSFINYHLTGEHATHISSAAALGLVDAVTGTWETAPIAGNPLPDLILPRIYRKVAPIGRIVGSRALVYPDIGDQQAAYAASGSDLARAPLMVSAGTAGLLSLSSARCITAPGVEARPYFDGSVLLTVTGLSGGDALDVNAAKEFIDAARRLPVILPDELYVTGGAGPKYRPVWKSIADALGIKELIVEERDASLLGLQVLAGRASGVIEEATK